MTADTFERKPQRDRDAIRGRESAPPASDLEAIRSRENLSGGTTSGPRATRRPRPRRFAFNGTSDPLNLIAPDPPTYLTTDFQQKQGSIGDYVKKSISAMWDQHINPDEFSDSWKDLGPIIKVLIAQYFDASAASGAEYYRNLTVVNDLPFPRVYPARFSGQHLNRMTGSVANGSFYHQLNTKGVEPGPASDIARNTLSGAGARFALNGARNTVIGAVARDPNAEGWERLIEPVACSYCSAQAAKGPFKPGVTSFRAHDNCSCLAMPILRGATMNPNSELRDQWNKITGTFTGKEARAAWDRYWSEHGLDNKDENPNSRDSSGTQEPGETGQGPAEQKRRRSTIPGAKRSISQESYPRSRAREG